MFKVNKKNTRTTSMTYFTHFSSVSIDAFEQVDASWTIRFKTQKLYFLVRKHQNISIKS